MELWIEAINAFWEGDPAAIICPTCGEAPPLVAWIYEPQWGFGTLGVTFWNWPRLSPDFIAKLGGVLSHPVKYVTGKL
jgi:hypothetical protein